MSSLRELLNLAVESQASDVHLKSGKVPILRIHSELIDIDADPMTGDALERVVQEILPVHLRTRFDSQHEADFSLFEEGVGRFRVNVFRSTGDCTVVMRHVKSRIPTFEELHLPSVMKNIALFQRGIVLATGTTGSGKSTTLAAMINHINGNDRRRIITIEDPVEYVFQDHKSVISQREVGLDTVSFHASLKHVLRQDPDVIMIGEMRDAESFMAALTAAETGHLVFSTLHTGTASQALPRILDLFPASERDQLRMALADNLKAVFCQRLIPGLQGGVRPAVEILISNSTVRKLIEKNLLEKLPAAIETGTDDGMQTFNQSIYKLIRSNDIAEKLGLEYATNAEALKMNLQGIFLDEARRILAT